MDANAKRHHIIAIATKLKADMLAAAERMPEDWEEVELCWYLARRAEMFSVPHTDHLRRKAYEDALRARRL